MKTKTLLSAVLVLLTSCLLSSCVSPSSGERGTQTGASSAWERSRR